MVPWVPMKRRILAVFFLLSLGGRAAPLAAAPPSKASLEAARKAVDELLSPPSTAKEEGRPFPWPPHAIERVEKIDWEKLEVVAAGASRRRGAFDEALDLAAFQALAAARLSAFQRLLTLAVDERRSLSDLIREQPHLGKLVEELLSRLVPNQQNVDEHGLVRVTVRFSLVPIVDFLVPLLHGQAPPTKEETAPPESFTTLRVFTGPDPYMPGLLPPLRALGEEASRKLQTALGHHLRGGGRPVYVETARGYGRSHDFVARSQGGLNASTLFLDDGDALSLTRLLEGQGGAERIILQILPGTPRKKAGGPPDLPASPSAR